MSRIPDYPSPTRAVDGTELLATWQDGKQIALPLSAVTALVGAPAAASAVSAQTSANAAQAAATAAAKRIIDYPSQTRALAGGDLVPGWQDGQQITIPLSVVAAFASAPAVASASAASISAAAAATSATSSAADSSAAQTAVAQVSAKVDALPIHTAATGAASGLVTSLVHRTPKGRSIFRYGPTHLAGGGLWAERFADGSWALSGPHGALIGVSPSGKPTYTGLPICTRAVPGAALALRGPSGRFVAFFVDPRDGALRRFGSAIPSNGSPFTAYLDGGVRLFVPGAGTVPLTDTSGTFKGQPEIVDTDVRWLVDRGAGLVREQQSLKFTSSLATGVSHLAYRTSSMQSNSVGRGQHDLLTSAPVLPGRVVMFPPGIRTLGNEMGQGDKLTVLDVATLSGITDAVEQVPGNQGAGETGWAQYGKRIAVALGSSTAVMLAAHGIGGRAYEEWGLPSTPIFQNVLIGLRRAQMMAAILGLSFDADYHHGVGGEADEAKSLASYMAQLNQYQADITAAFNAAIPGRTGEVVLVQAQMSSWETGAGPALSDVPLAQLQVALDAPTKHVCAGPTYQHPFAPDGLHLTGLGQFHRGEIAGWYESRHKAGQPALPLYPSAASISANVVTVTISGMLGALTIDTALVSDPGHLGVEFGQSGGNSVTIVDVAISGSNRIVVTLSATPTGTSRWIGFGLTGAIDAAAGPTSGPRTSFRDTVAMLTSADGASTPLYKHLCHSRLAL